MFGWLRRKTIKREIVINAENLETRVAVMEEGRLEEYQVEHPTQERIVGNIYKGRIQNLEHDLQAAFVDIGLKKNAFLHYWDMLPDGVDEEDEEDDRRRSRRRRISNEDIARRFPPGSEIVIQITKGPIGTKGPRATASLSIPGRHLVMMPGTGVVGVSRKITDSKERQRLKKILDRLPVPEGMGLIVRTASAGASQRSLVRDLRGLLVVWEELRAAIDQNKAPCSVYEEPDLVERVVRDWLTEDVDRIVIDNADDYERVKKSASKAFRRARSRIHHYHGEMPVFDHYGVERQLDEAFRRKVNLKCGGYVILDETEALVAIDVNTGRHKGSGQQEQAILEVNTEAVREVARQLRLRNIGGLVVIDLIDMKSRKHQNAVYREMRTALKRDRARTNVLAISSLGIMEMTRQRVEEGIHSSMFVDCPYCRGRGSVTSPLGMSVEIQRQVAAVLRKQQKKATTLALQVAVHPTVLERMRSEDEEFLMELQSRLKGSLVFRSEPARHMESFAISDVQTGEVLYSTTGKPSA
ncbi:MAG: Rne/Rng family ribonuclease [Lentisphaerae bacterium]|nr:Rne/Rng family ribonuclease [Lentisphaerota bacterium]